MLSTYSMYKRRNDSLEEGVAPSLYFSNAGSAALSSMLAQYQHACQVWVFTAQHIFMPHSAPPSLFPGPACRFVATPVPKSTRELRYHQLMAEQHVKRAATHQQ